MYGGSPGEHSDLLRTDQLPSRLVGHRALGVSDGLRLPGAVFEAVQAPGLGDKIGVLASGSAKVFPIAQPRPGVGSVQFSPAVVIRVIALVRASGKVRHAPGGDQQPDG
jgi:hypothetical protein